MRPPLLNPLFADVTALPGLGPTAARRLERLGLTRVRDLLFHLPTGWIRSRAVGSLAEARSGERVSLALRLIEVQPCRGRAPARIIGEDGRGEPLALVFFGAKADRLATRHGKGADVRVTGTLEAFQGRWQMVHPEIGSPAATLREVEPVYPLTEGLTRRQMAGFIARALARVPPLPEWVDGAMLAREGWPGFREALALAHADPQAEKARDRLAYDELLAGQLAWALVRRRARARRSTQLVGDGRLTAEILAALPFRPTGAQQRAAREIAEDMARPAAMLRLLQGDVGSGKTLVAALALATAVEAGAQGAVLAPTELLARQHLATFTTLFAGTGIRLGFLSGRETGRGREALLARLAEGAIDVLVGTHAIFQQGVHYPRLGLAVIDEQHRFGVAQRLMLQEKAALPPHLLVMTATPIPRTLALARFGEMDLSVLDEKPPGRTAVDTRVIAARRMEEVVAGLGRHLSAGHQAYWVCPMVDGGDGEGGQEGAEAAVARARMLKARFGDQVELVHGRMPARERDRVMERFRNGDARVLVATTVIEVGVDVPAATLMVIEAAEMFGLAQLHQLRGRVGRGSGRSTCLLLAGDGLG
ncbi:ATP-dependent DNA helicase RecG, partial [Thermaurantiacus sp.]